MHNVRSSACHREDSKTIERVDADVVTAAQLDVTVAGKFHVEHKLVRRHTLQQELPGIGIPPFVPLQRDLKQAKPKGGGEQENQHQCGQGRYSADR
jgi:hypothetical protein